MGRHTEAEQRSCADLGSLEEVREMRAQHLTPFLLLFVIGCGVTPRAQWAEQRSLLSAVQDTLVELHQGNIISDHDFLKAHSASLIARRYLEEARQYFDEDTGEAKNEDAFEQTLTLAKAIIHGLQGTIVAFSRISEEGT